MKRTNRHRLSTEAKLESWILRRLIIGEPYKAKFGNSANFVFSVDEWIIIAETALKCAVSKTEFRNVMRKLKIQTGYKQGNNTRKCCYLDIKKNYLYTLGLNNFYYRYEKVEFANALLQC